MKFLLMHLATSESKPQKQDGPMKSSVSRSVPEPPSQPLKIQGEEQPHRDQEDWTSGKGQGQGFGARNFMMPDATQLRNTENVHAMIMQQLERKSSRIVNLNTQQAGDAESKTEVTEAGVPTKQHYHILDVQWDMKQFIAEQFGDKHGKICIGSLITLTGSAQWAQASTVRDYLNRHWPTTGPLLLKALQNALDFGWSVESKGNSFHSL